MVISQSAIVCGSRLKGLPQRCDGCKITVEHGLNCKKGSLVGIIHDDLRDEYVHIRGLALSERSVNSKRTIVYRNDTMVISPHRLCIGR